MYRLPSGERPPADHHSEILFLAHAGHQAGAFLKAHFVREEKFAEVIYVRTEFQQLVVIAIEHGLLLFLGHRPFIKVGAFVGQEIAPCFLLSSTSGKTG